MTTETKIRCVTVADDSHLRKMEVRIGDHTIVTPSKSFETKDMTKATSFRAATPCLNEIFTTLNNDSLKKMDMDIDYIHKKNSLLSSQQGKGQGLPTITIVKCALKCMPTQEQIDILTSVAYSHSDMTPIPSLPDVSIDIDNSPLLLDYLKSCIDTINVWNRKKIMGYIPLTAPAILRDIVNFYLDNGINSYYIDFDGKGLKTSKTMLTHIQREIAARGYEENSFIHFININPGKTSVNNPVVPATDFLGFGFGFDSMGGSHISPKLPPAVFANMGKNLSQNKIRLFDKDSYGYRKVIAEDTAEVLKCYPHDAIIPLETFQSETRSSTLKKMVNVVNLNEKMKEAEQLSIVAEEAKKSLDYFKSKKHLPDKDFKLIAKK